MTKEIINEFRDWFIIIVTIVWFFFLLDISHRQAEHERAVEIGNVFYAPDHNDGYFRAIIRDEKERMYKTKRRMMKPVRN